MALVQTVSDFLNLSEAEIMIDVRSPGEYTHGHIPGAINIPLLDNEERRIVGTCYKREGREPAVIKGFELVGHKFADFIKHALVLAPEKKIKVYCWRGGLRSNIMAWILNMSGFKVSLLKGGYKSYRSFVHEISSQDFNLLILGGATGCGKTELLHLLRERGEQVIDLEGLAKHKGSAFGGLGQDPQPTYEQFENLLANELMQLDQSRRIWLENESRLIGSVKIPDVLFENIRKAPVLEISIPFEKRIDRLAQEYGHFDPEILAENTTKLTKRLGHQRMADAVQKVRSGDIRGWIADILTYYDKTYAYGKSLRESGSITEVQLPDDNFMQHIDAILASAGAKLNKEVSSIN